MKQYLADLHIHSHYSRATSKGLTPRNLAAFGELKGLAVVGSGDFTHPGWLADLRRDLIEDGTGLLRLADTADPAGLGREIPWLPDFRPEGRVRFMLSAEISSIYKRGGKVRKVHNLVFAPSLDVAETINRKLSKVGNLASDGRPILGLDSRDLLELVLETDKRAFLVPAHIWTPWFSVFGSKSGFDSLEECFGDLSKEIFALETGLSSDPDMNWTLSALDRFRLISNSDAHSGEKLGRECNLFCGEASYEGIHRALRGENGGRDFCGTVEFFPEEGKYHLDGHRDCHVVMEPAEAKARGGICPVCGKQLTLGVLHRVLDLADRTEPARPPGMPGFTSLIPLDELAGEIMGVGPKTGKARRLTAALYARFGAELTILRETPPEDLAKVNTVLAEAVSRMRQGRVERTPGFDGEYGRITVFSAEEKRDIKAGRFRPVPAGNSTGATPRESASDGDAPPEPPPAGQTPRSAPARPDLNAAQEAAVTAAGRHLLVVAGPGTGKTHTLLAKIRSLLEAGVPADKILAVTFTRRAAGELRDRLARDIPALADGTRTGAAALPRADTLHALALAAWTEAGGREPVLLSEEAARRLFALANPGLAGARLKAAWRALDLSRERLEPLEPAADTDGSDGPGRFAARYAAQKAAWNLLDFTDLLEFWLEKLTSGDSRPDWSHILVDEVQDLTPLQLALVAALAGPDRAALFAIGDPDQSIYGFRGATGGVEARLAALWPDLAVAPLAENYRSAQPVLDLAAGLFPGRRPLVSRLGPILPAAGGMELFAAPTAGAEAEWMAGRIQELLGGTSLTLTRDFSVATLSPGDVAVLVRFSGLVPAIRKSLERRGIPCAAPEADAFFNEPRVRLLLAAAGRHLGLPAALGEAGDADGPTLPALPDAILARGPRGLAALLQDSPPFDRLFWQGPQFRDLCRAYDTHKGWAGLLNHVAGETEIELVGRLAEKVRIMTLHAAKGLEFAAVFLPALEDGILPFAGAAALTGAPGGTAGDPAGRMDEDEERRLFYVGLTRAKTRLFLSHAKRRDLFGKRLALPRSRFLEELDLGGVRQRTLAARTVRQARQLPLLGGGEPTI
ncbi:UvrD/REP helicase [Solidesulfovibrio carbinoliphilus subsp. oakridgensis]|uniref:UvrD/REP helicase n=1 Tax=Solidesulfovibrio carbinoliphilus subsp. oakridgensis TaxID=694327 RepID=G7Q809_9BACT|nr:UvrD-helicase domain-containing protein [Solidesulfovibrio carbinoliphilus]EHJ47703.1 UvrD/REP helicase [Solidesulfovibrio carbinoliphilus subsp. oakridgensis]